jgi:Acetyl-CoA dehydrogenase C-terminal like
MKTATVISRKNPATTTATTTTGNKAVGPLVADLQKAQMELAGFVMGLQATVKAGGLEALVPVLNASPLLEAMGHIIMDWMLLDMAVLAQSKLDELVTSKGVNAEDTKELRAFIGDNEEAKFLYGKVKSAEWFSNNMLPHANAIFDSIKKKDVSAMKIIF